MDIACASSEKWGEMELQRLLLYMTCPHLDDGLMLHCHAEINQQQLCQASSCRPRRLKLCSSRCMANSITAVTSTDARLLLLLWLLSATPLAVTLCCPGWFPLTCLQACLG